MVESQTNASLYPQYIHIWALCHGGGNEKVETLVSWTSEVLLWDRHTLPPQSPQNITEKVRHFLLWHHRPPSGLDTLRVQMHHGQQLQGAVCVAMVPLVCLEGKVWKGRAKYQGHCVVGWRIYEYIRTPSMPCLPQTPPWNNQGDTAGSTAVTGESILPVSKGTVKLADSYTTGIKVSLIPSKAIWQFVTRVINISVLAPRAISWGKKPKKEKPLGVNR